MKISTHSPPECTILRHFPKFSWGSMPRDAPGLSLHLLAVAGIWTIIKSCCITLIIWLLNPTSMHTDVFTLLWGTCIYIVTLFIKNENFKGAFHKIDLKTGYFLCRICYFACRFCNFACRFYQSSHAKFCRVLYALLA